MNKTYAGIGARATPDEIIQQMIILAEFLGKVEYTLRSGGALGADSAFEQGCDNTQGKKEIFLPWANLNGNKSLYTKPSAAALQLASTIHPNFKNLSDPIKLYIGRNMHQILGLNLDDPVDMVICWTEDGCESHNTYTQKTGGTGSAIALASKHFIPVYNLFNPGQCHQAFNDTVDCLYCYLV